MGVFSFIAGRKKPTPSAVAKERLKVVLAHDRLKMNPELMELIKADLLTAISRRLEVDEQQLQLHIAREDRRPCVAVVAVHPPQGGARSEEHTSELQSRQYLV